MESIVEHALLNLGVSLFEILIEQAARRLEFRVTECLVVLAGHVEHEMVVYLFVHFLYFVRRF